MALSKKFNDLNSCNGERKPEMAGIKTQKNGEIYYASVDLKEPFGAICLSRFDGSRTFANRKFH
jgi:hypothetical protein